ncbi:MAG TPA: reductive dehalogenase [Syntrophorhabdaceae bacterium]|nr:reductive dehalogenase [Syntrophorhabdaceae bacterium]
MSGYQKRHLGNFPMHKIKRVDRPTTIIHDNAVQRVSESDAGFMKARRGLHGPTLQKEVGRFVTKHPMSGTQWWIMGEMRQLVDGMAAKQIAPIPNDPRSLSRHIKEAAYFLRADVVGICELPPYAVYSHTYDPKNADGEGIPVNLNHKYAIGILVDQDWPTAEAFSGHDWISNAMSMLAYSNSGFIAIILADYIRRLGYPARAHYARNYQVVLPPILLWAGLGEMSRIGDCVVNPFLGPRFKAAVVTTDLPLFPDKPIDFGLQDFCSKCRKCARECPSGALSDGDKEMFNGYEKWPNDVLKCTKMRVGNQKGSGCGTCIKVCPWNKPYTSFHRAVGWAMRRSAVARSLAIKADDLMGYGKPDYANKWWLDLEDVEGDGVLVVPDSTRRSNV